MIPTVTRLLVAALLLGALTSCTIQTDAQVRDQVNNLQVINNTAASPVITPLMAADIQALAQANAQLLGTALTNPDGTPIVPPAAAPPAPAGSSGLTK